ncbi:unnamed protein product [Amoebophrya sp. A120]|nr:unnamed protein product [Amoebophrya sp. A120]|eukprot:GSA120T00003874001.1
MTIDATAFLNRLAGPTWEEVQECLLSENTSYGIQVLYRCMFAVRSKAPSQKHGIDILRQALNHDDSSRATVIPSRKRSSEEANQEQEGSEIEVGPTKQQKIISSEQNQKAARPDKQSILFRHECCYLLGQFGADVEEFELKQQAFESLLQVLDDATEDEVTRHEAAEGIAAIFNNNLRDEDEERIRDYFHKIYTQRTRIHGAALTSALLGDDEELERQEDHEELDSHLTFAPERNEFADAPSPSSNTYEATADTDEELEDEVSPPIEAETPIIDAVKEKTLFVSDSTKSAKTLMFRRRNDTLIKLLEQYVLPSEGGASEIESRMSSSGSTTMSPTSQRPLTALSQTCYLAVEGLRRETARVCACQFASYDPALGEANATKQDIPRLLATLSDPKVELFQRYIAMFTLRNLNAVQPLGEALLSDRSSPVLRHEIAFILGQIESEEAVHFLAENLNLPHNAEHGMVRHESAIALGSIGGESAKEWLRRFCHDPDVLVAESCLVALDTIHYWEMWEREEERILNQR